jgi:hypothetical protein
VVDLDQLLYNDAKKEFAATASIGFGADGDEETRRLDFEAVRGTFEGNGFVAEIRKHIETKTELGNELLGRMEPLRQTGAGGRRVDVCLTGRRVRRRSPVKGEKR